MNRFLPLSSLVAMGLLFGVSASATPITSVQGFLATPNSLNQIIFDYDPVQGSVLNVQSWGYGGSSGAPGGVNLNGNVIAAGGFDPIVTLFAGTGDAATWVATNDDGLCPPGTISAGSCYDATLNLTGLSAGTYTLVLTAFSNFAVADETGETLGLGFQGGGSFSGRTDDFAVDVQAVPEPMTSMLLGSGLLALGYIMRRRRRQ